MAKNQNIYGSDPDGGASHVSDVALRLMKSKGIVDKAEETTGKGTSRDELEKNLGHTKA